MKIAFIISLFYISMQTINAQDKYNSAFASSPLMLNPAYAGTFGNSNLRVNANYYWNTNFDILHEKNLNLTFDKTIMNGRMGIGGDFSYQFDGFLRRDNHAMLVVAYNNIVLKNNLKLSAGLKGGYVQNSVDWEEVIFYSDEIPELFHPSLYEEDINDKHAYADFDIGFLALRNTDKNQIMPWIGFSVIHLFKPDVSFFSVSSNLHRKLSLQCGVDLPVIENVVFTPLMLYLKQNYSKKISIGGSAKYQDEKFMLSIGGMFKHENESILENKQICILAGIGYAGFALRLDFKVLEKVTNYSIYPLNSKVMGWDKYTIDSKGSVGLSFAIK